VKLIKNEVSEHSLLWVCLTRVIIHSLDAWLLILLSFEVPPQYHKHSLHNFCKPQQPDFHLKISGFLAAIKLTDKSGYPDNGYPDMQSLDVIIAWCRHTVGIVWWWCRIVGDVVTLWCHQLMTTFWKKAHGIHLRKRGWHWRNSGLKVGSKAAGIERLHRDVINSSLHRLSACVDYARINTSYLLLLCQHLYSRNTARDEEREDVQF